MSLFLTEIKKKMKLSITLVLLAIASYAFAQSNNSNSRSTKIDENEKKRLENQFKALNTFYIDDDGLVVYQKQESSTPQSQEETPASTTSNTSSASKNVKSQESEEQHLVKEENERPRSVPVERAIQNSNHQTSIPSEVQTPAANRAPVLSGVIKKEALRPTETTVSTARVSEPTESRSVKNSPIEFQQREEELPQPETKVVAAKTKDTTPAKSTTKKASVFDKKNRASQYRTMEEAALAVEALLDDLRKEQAQTTSAGSMSSRLSGGAGRSTLRKKPTTNPSYNSSDSYSSAPNKSQTIVEVEESPFGDEPTYYINGKEVDRIEVNRLRRKEIISKEVRTRNTVSGNPNGEVWYEVKYDN